MKVVYAAEQYIVTVKTTLNINQHNEISKAKLMKLIRTNVCDLYVTSETTKAHLSHLEHVAAKPVLYKI